MAQGMMTLKFNRKLVDKLQDMKDRFIPAFLMIATMEAIKLESHMKTHRPWTDQTGKAKQTLNARASQPDSNTIRITLAHGVSYGIWLELAHEQNYAIVNPTLKLKGPGVLKSFENFIEKLV